MATGMPEREGKRGLTRRTGSFKTVALLMLIPVGGIVLFFLWSFLHNALSLLHRPAHTEASGDSADRRVMTDVLGALPKGMYFIDSKTTGNSIAGSLARTMRVKTASRNVFLDDVQNVVSIRRQLAELADTAASRGVSVGI